MQRYILLPPNLDVFAALVFDGWDEPTILAMLASAPGIQGVHVHQHDNREWLTLSATDGHVGATWSTPFPLLAAPEVPYPDLMRFLPAAAPLLRVTLDAARLAKLAAAAARCCQPGGTVELTLYPAGSSPARPDGPAPLVLTGESVGGGTFVGFLLPVVSKPATEGQR
jgi:hypothetical protein